MARLLYMGCSAGPDVMDLQDALNVITTRAGHRSVASKLVVDGIFGQRTRSRVTEFERQAGVMGTGSVDATTWQRLHDVLRTMPGMLVLRPLGGGGATGSGGKTGGGHDSDGSKLAQPAGTTQFGAGAGLYTAAKHGQLAGFQLGFGGSAAPGGGGGSGSAGNGKDVKGDAGYDPQQGGKGVAASSGGAPAWLTTTWVTALAGPQRYSPYNSGSGGQSTSDGKGGGGADSGGGGKGQ